VLNLECFIKTEDVRGLHGKLLPWDTVDDKMCARACILKRGCVAFDFNTFELGGSCRLLTSNETKAASKKGRIIHFQLAADDPGCAHHHRRRRDADNDDESKDESEDESEDEDDLFHQQFA